MSTIPRYSWIGGAAVALVIWAMPSLAQQWESVGPVGARVDGIAQSRSNPDRMYALIHGRGVFRTDDRGDTWTLPSPAPALGSQYEVIAVSRVDPDVVVIARHYGDEVLRSVDGAVTWTLSTVIEELVNVLDIEFDPFDGNLVLLTEAGLAQRIHRSTDAGVTWAPVNVGFTFTIPNQIEYHPSVSGTVLIAGRQGVIRSTNSGVSWVLANMSGRQSNGFVSYCRSLPSTVWAGERFSNVFLRSTNGGTSFEPQGDPPCCSFQGIAADVLEPDTIVGGFSTGGVHGIHRSTDSGMTWGPPSKPFGELPINQSLSSLMFDATNPDLVYSSVGNGYGFESVMGMARSTDAGISWSSWMNGLSCLSMIDAQPDPADRVFAFGDGTSLIWKTEDYGSTWGELGTGTPFQAITVEVSRQVPGLIHIGGVYSNGFDVFVPLFARSTDSGATWTSTDLYPLIKWQTPIPNCITSDPTGMNIWMWCDDFTLFRSTDGGSSFVFLEIPFRARAAIAAGAEGAPGLEKLYAIQKDAPGTVWYSSNGGDSWTQWAAGTPNNPGVALFLDPPGRASRGVGNGIVAVFRTAGAYHSSGLGDPWMTIPLPGYQGQAIADADWDSDGGMLFLCTSTSGVYITGRGFVTEGLPTTSLRSITYLQESQTLLVGTKYASVYRLELDDVVASPPRSSSLGLTIRAVPTPSRDGANLAFSIPQDAPRVRISVVDVRGRRVADLFDGPLGKGAHSVPWDGRSRDGERVAAGIYFARLELDQATTSARITLLRD